jgi:hypothetical protein
VECPNQILEYDFLKNSFKYEKLSLYLAKSALAARQILASLAHGPHDSNVTDSDQMLNNLNGINFFKNLLQLQKLN